ncbi:uncharacterized protein [Dendropsophus ebraccatus]|uniref:uncharacterized protein n=1 Tax=Dendropsophus ebraccatus TaxID=150705 RepID=UPI0038316F6A
MTSQQRTVSIGIFSRDDESSYQWLTTRLSTNYHVRNIYPVYISNRSLANIIEGINSCTFAILYHTKKRGRINITDVTDSLYDEELEHLSSTKGKENVIVLIDDLEGDGSGHRTRILQHQPSIQRLASELFCFTVEEKRTLTTDCPAPEMVEKLRQIEKMIGGRAPRKTLRRVYIISCIVAIVLFWVVRCQKEEKPGFWAVCQRILQKAESFLFYLKRFYVSPRHLLLFYI